MKLEQRYLVFKISDLQKFLSYEQREMLDAIDSEISIGRHHNQKQDLECLCIEKDWPEYEIVLSLLSERINHTDRRMGE